MLLRRSVVAPLPTFFELKRRMAYKSLAALAPNIYITTKVYVKRADPFVPDINVATKNVRIRRCSSDATMTKFVIILDNFGKSSIFAAFINKQKIKKKE